MHTVNAGTACTHAIVFTYDVRDGSGAIANYLSTSDFAEFGPHARGMKLKITRVELLRPMMTRDREGRWKTRKYVSGGGGVSITENSSLSLPRALRRSRPRNHNPTQICIQLCRPRRHHSNSSTRTCRSRVQSSRCQHRHRNKLVSTQPRPYGTPWTVGKRPLQSRGNWLQLCMHCLIIRIRILVLILLKLNFSQYPSIHTNYIISHCTTL